MREADVTYAPCPSSVEPRDPVNNYYSESFLTIAVHCKLDWFLKHKIESGELKKQPRCSCPLLICTLKDCDFSPNSLRLDQVRFPDNQFRLWMVEALLKAGEDPNCSFQIDTPWHIVLRRIEAETGSLNPVWMDVARLLLQYGAIPSDGAAERYPGALDYLRTHFPPSLSKKLGKGSSRPLQTRRRFANFIISPLGRRRPKSPD
jgi:hypothetical protein